jgi:hypothetical protein
VTPASPVRVRRDGPPGHRATVLPGRREPRNERDLDTRQVSHTPVVVRTGARAAGLQAILASAGLTPATAPPAPRLSDLGPLAAKIESLYRALGGRQLDPSLRPGAWDLAVCDGLLVELDEELHFNRYRRLTMEATWAAPLPWSSDYRRHCVDYEPSCLAAAQWGKRWTNPSCERLFGAGATPGELAGGGAPRWKQRALYDAIKDAAASAGSVQLARVATVDVVAGAQLGDVLAGRSTVAPGLVADFVRRRAAV